MGTGFSLSGSGNDLPSSSANTTTLTMFSSHSSPYHKTFNLTFVPQLAETGMSILISNGTIATNACQGDNFTASPDDDCEFYNMPAIVYLPQGASLTFSISSPNTAGATFFTMDDFNAEAVPAPLPSAGSSAVLLDSRRLRRRTLSASKQPPTLHPTTGKVMSLAEQRASLQRQLALKHYGIILGGPVQPVLPISRSTNKS